MSLTRTIQRLSELQAKNGTPVAVILGSSVNALSYVRSLGRRGIPVLCADHAKGIAARSRFGRFLLLDRRPGEMIPGEHAADHLFASLRDAGVSTIAFGSADEWQVYIANRAETNRSLFRSLAPTRAVVDCIVDKQAQYERAVAAGINVPRFANARDVSEGQVPWNDFPAIVKPRWSHSGRGPIGGKAVRADTPAELASRLQSLDQAVDLGAYLVQKVVDGRDDGLYAYLACFDDRGQERSYVVKRKLRQHPPSFGDGCFDMTCEAPEVAAAGRKLLVSMGYRGLVGVEFKKDRITGEFSMIEINPRTVSTNQLAITAGVDFPWHSYQLAVSGSDAAGLDIPAQSGLYRRNVHHLHEDRELRSFLQRWRRKETGVIEWVRSISCSRSFAIWSGRDPWPFMVTVASWAGGAFRAFRRPRHPSRNSAGEDGSLIGGVQSSPVSGSA